MVSNWQEEFCINLLKLASRGNEESYKLALQIHSMSSSFNQKSNLVLFLLVWQTQLLEYFCLHTTISQRFSVTELFNIHRSMLEIDAL